MKCVFRVISALVLFSTVYSVPTGASQCQQITYRNFEFVEENGQYIIRFKDPESLRLHPNVVREGQVIRPLSIQAIADEVAARAGAAAVFVQHGPNVANTVTPFPLDRVWKGDDPLSSLRALCESAGLSILVQAGGVWLIGPEEDLKNSAVVVFVYPIDGGHQPLIGHDLAEVIFRGLPIRSWPAYSTHEEPDLRWVSIGYLGNLEIQDEMILSVREGVDYSDPGVNQYLMKIRISKTESGPRASCVWQSVAHGTIVTGFDEDVDGDGVSDILLKGVDAGWPEKWDQIISGATGGLLAEFGSEVVAVEKRDEGSKLISVKMIRSDMNYPIARLLRFDEEKSTFVVETTEVDRQAQVKRERNEPLYKLTIGRLLQETGDPGSVTAYVLPGMRPSEPVPEGVDVVHSDVYNCFDRMVVTGSRLLSDLDDRLNDCPDVDVLVRYIPEGYTREYLKRWPLQ